MEIIYYKLPFEHIIIKDFFDSDELKEVNSEIDKINNFKDILSNLLTSKSGTAKKEGILLAQRTAFFIEEIFHQNFYKSKIYTHATKPFKEPLIKEISENSTFGVCLRSINFTSLLVSLYKDSDYYLPHPDKSLLTGTCFISRNIDNITGGELYFPEYDNFKILPEFNTFILFPSHTVHGVLPVNFIDKNTDKETVRISLNMFTFVLP
jgi:hypothetical protein